MEVSVVLLMPTLPLSRHSPTLMFARRSYPLPLHGPLSFSFEQNETLASQ